MIQIPFNILKDDTPKDLEERFLKVLSSEFWELNPGKWVVSFGKPKRTDQQNKALHKWCTGVAQNLNKVGERFAYQTILGKEVTKEWDMMLVKDFIWRPAQIAIVKKESTTKLTTDEVDKVAKPLIEMFKIHFDLDIPFPSKDSQTFY